MNATFKKVLKISAVVIAASVIAFFGYGIVAMSYVYLSIVPLAEAYRYEEVVLKTLGAYVIDYSHEPDEFSVAEWGPLITYGLKSGDHPVATSNWEKDVFNSQGKEFRFFVERNGEKIEIIIPEVPAMVLPPPDYSLTIDN